MNFREPLEAKLKKDGKQIESAVIDFFYSKPTPIKDEEIGMYKPYLTSELKKFSVQHYGKELSENVLSKTLDELVKRHSKISTVEIKYCLDKIIEKDELKPFNGRGLVQFINQYEHRKKDVSNTYSIIKSELWEDMERERKTVEYLQSSLKKYSDSEHLNVYEKSTLGKHFAKQANPDDIQLIREEVTRELGSKQHELSKMRAVGLDLFFVDKEMNVPIMWTSSLLFGVLVFEKIVDVNKKGK